MALSEGELVRCFHSVSNLWEVVDTDVERDVDVSEARGVWRMPGGNTLLRNTAKPGIYMVCAAEQCKPRSAEVSSA